jgi:anti-sigma factor RsiW
MTQLPFEQIMDYLDGTLSSAETARIEEHLKNNAEDAQMVNDIRFAMGTTQDLRESETWQVSENFWPKLRDNLGPAPKRSLLSNLRKSMSSMFGTSPAARFSVGAATVAIVIAMGAFLFAPQNATSPVVAGPKMTQADQMFIQQAVQKHEAYVQSQPAPGDVSSIETGAEDDNEPEIP